MTTELLDIYAADGTTRLGSKPRDAVHRDGDWHLAFHLWVVSAAGVLLQRRAASKQAWPSRLDATAAGHLVAGETIADGLREVDEELGITYTMDQLVALGVFRVDESAAFGMQNREHQHVFAVRDDRPLADWTAWNRDELDGLVLLGHDAFATLTRGNGPVPARTWDGAVERDVRVCAAELVPAPYLTQIAPRLTSQA